MHIAEIEACWMYWDQPSRHRGEDRRSESLVCCELPALSTTLTRLSPTHYGAVRPNRRQQYTAIDNKRQQQQQLISIADNTTRHNATQHNAAQHKITQHNTTQHSTTKHNTTQHRPNTTQHGNKTNNRCVSVPQHDSRQRTTTTVDNTAIVKHNKYY